MTSAAAEPCADFAATTIGRFIQMGRGKNVRSSPDIPATCRVGLRVSASSSRRSSFSARASIVVDSAVGPLRSCLPLMLGSFVLHIVAIASEVAKGFLHAVVHAAAVLLEHRCESDDGVGTPRDVGQSTQVVDGVLVCGRHRLPVPRCVFCIGLGVGVRQARRSVHSSFSKSARARPVTTMGAAGVLRPQPPTRHTYMLNATSALFS